MAALPRSQFPLLSSWWLTWIYQDGYNSYMKRASISEAKNQLSALIDYVRHGASVLILDRGRPVARLDGISDEGGDERLARLERAGLIVRGTGPFPAKLIAQKPPSATASVLEALLDERREGR